MSHWWPYSSLPVTLVLCSGGLRNILYAFGLGYGFSMSANSLLTLLIDQPRLLSASGAPTLPGCGACLYLAYGARLASFLFRRQMSASYQPKLRSVAEKSERSSSSMTRTRELQRMHWPKRAGFWFRGAHLKQARSTCPAQLHSKLTYTSAGSEYLLWGVSKQKSGESGLRSLCRYPLPLEQPLAER